MNKKLTLLFFCFLSLNCFGQELKLLRGKDHKTFKEGSIFEVIIAENNASNDKRCCNYTELIGKITLINGDSLTLQLSSYTNKKTVENVKIEDVFYSQTGTIKATIAQNEIFYLRNFKSYKSKKRKEGFLIAGGLLLFTGAVTALNAFIVNDKSNKNNLLISGGIQIGLGLGFLISSDSKKYYLNNAEDTWAIKK